MSLWGYLRGCKFNMKKRKKIVPTNDGIALFNARHSDYCGLCNKETPCKHFMFCNRCQRRVRKLK